jgi:metal-sulfur cluster biosynthetic enzyme
MIDEEEPMIDTPTTDWHAEARRDSVLAALGNVWDPELGLDVVSLGLVYDVRVLADRVEVDMTLTTPGCPVSEQLPAEAEAAVRTAVPDVDVIVNVVWDPPWTPERLSPIALQQLGFTRRR